MFKKAVARMRHRQLVTTAKDLVREAYLVQSRSVYGVTSEQVIALAFTRYQLAVEADEAQRHLDGALVSLGFPLQQPAA